MDLEEKPPDPPEKEQVFRIIKCPLKCVLKNYDVIQPIIERFGFGGFPDFENNMIFVENILLLKC
jgi:hypothetical protein